MSFCFFFHSWVACTVWKIRKFTLTLFPKFRESNISAKEFTEELISRNFFFRWERISCFSSHTLEITEIYPHTFFWQTFRESNGLNKYLLKKWFHEIFFGEREFLVFPHCAIINLHKSTEFDRNFVKSSSHENQSFWLN